MTPERSGRPIAVFLTATGLLSAIFYTLIIVSGQVGGGGGAYIGGLMWCPGLAALLTCKVLGRSPAALGWGWGKTRYVGLSYLLPLGYATVTYAIVWSTGLGGFYRTDFVTALATSFGLGAIPPWATISLYFASTATIGVVRGAATVLGEEIGWRGFLVPELAKRHGFVATAVISGLIWAVWHYPIFLFASGYGAGTPVWYYLPLFTLGLPIINMIWTWLRLKSGSIWPGVVLHATHNTLIQQFFSPLTVDTGRTNYAAGEFGAVLFGVILVVAAYFWTRRSEVLPPTSPPEAAILQPAS